MPTLPSGTVTFLFTDIEGSTRRWEQHPEAMGAAVTHHDALLRQIIEAERGYIFKTVGDAFCAAFAQAPAALAAALAVQRACAQAAWGVVGPIRVRIALHTGVAEERDGDYFGPPLNRVARLLATGAGGQTLLSQAAQELVRPSLPSGVELRDLGEHRLKDLIRPERIFQLAAPDLPTDFPALKTLDTRPTNLPLQPTTLIGRERNLVAALALLRQPEVRLMTFTGPGGTGKTRLSLQVAADLLDEFADGVFFVPLAAIRDPALVGTTLATTLGVRESGGQPLLDSLKDYLRAKHLLLVLDNFEQVTEAAPLVADLLSAAPRLKVLVSSRIVLHLRGEREFAVPPLALPDPRQPTGPAQVAQYAAVRLFIERAQDVNPDFAVTNENASTIAKICAKLDGLPLALELAAARCKLLAPGALLARLDHRLALLTGGARDLPARQQTLRAAIAWSYDLLPAAQQQLFRELAVFAGGCTLAAVEAVCALDGPPEADLFDGLTALVDQSLLRLPDPAAEEPRFGMLETIREFAAEQLAQSGTAAAVWQAHADYFLALAEAAAPALQGPEQALWLARLDAEYDNLRAALQWATAHDAPDRGLRLAGALWPFWWIRGYWGEGRTALAALLGAAGAAGAAAVRAQALLAAGFLALALGEAAAAPAPLAESRALYTDLGDLGGQARTLGALSWAASSTGDQARRITLLEESLALHRQGGDRRGMAESLNQLGQAALRQGQRQDAMACFTESVALYRAVGDQFGLAVPLCNLGLVALEAAQYPQARQHLTEALAISRALYDKAGLATALRGLCWVALEEGDYPQAAAYQTECLRLGQELGSPAHQAWSWLDAAEIARCSGAMATAAAAAAAAQSLALERPLELPTLRARAQAVLGVAVGQQGQYAAGQVQLVASLVAWRDLGQPGEIATTLEWLAGVVGAAGQSTPAAQLFGAAAAIRAAQGARAAASERVHYARDLAAVRVQLSATAWDRAWAAGQALSLDEAVTYAQALGGTDGLD